VIRALGAIALREVRLGWSGGGGALLPASFFAGAVMVAPFALGPDPEMLAKIGPGYLWLALALSMLVSLERLFQADLEDGTLDQLAITALPLALVALAKVAGQWLATALPLLAVTPLAALMVRAEAALVPALAAQLALGSVALVLIGSIGAALGVGVRRGGLLVALIALPLYAPPVIFGAAAADLLARGEGFWTQPLLLLASIALGALALAPLAVAASLRLHLD
jgi:heme exporter protein B